MMKKKLSFIRAITAAVLFLGVSLPITAQHVPLVSLDDCPGATAAKFAPLPTFVQTTVGSPVTAWPPVGSYDFCGYMDTIFCQLKPLGSVAAEVLDYAYLLRCLDADINGQVYNEPAAEVPVSISVNSSGQCTVYWNGVLVHNNVSIPGWNPEASWRMGFGGRTGGANDYHIVDDFDLASSVMNYHEAFVGGPGSGTLYGSAAISSNQLVLTTKNNSLTGSWTFLPSGAVSSFTVTYMQYIGDGSGADGMCFFYGAGADSAFGEAGPTAPQTGLRVSFYTYSPDNTIRLAYNGATVADSTAAGELRQTGDWLPISGNGMPDGQYELALLAYVLNTPTHPLHTSALAVFQANFIFVKNLVQQALQSAGYLGLAPLMAPHLIGSLSMQLAGYAALGDPNTCAALNAVLDLLSDIGITPPAGGIEAWTDPVPTVGSIYDYESDGFANIDEFFYVEDELGLTISGYMDYAMNPATASVLGAKYYQVGTRISLRPRLTYGGIIEGVDWEKDSTPVGSTNPLVIDNCAYTDAGVYTAIVTHRMGDAKGTAQTIGTGTVVVGDEPVPVAELAGLAALSGAIALLAARRMRRRS